MQTLKISAKVRLKDALQYLSDVGHGEVESISLIGGELIAKLKQ